MNTSATSHPTVAPALRRLLASLGAALLVVAVVPSVSSAATVADGRPATRPVTRAQNSTAAAPPRAAAVGRLAPTGCTGPASAVSCDLYAMAGTTSLPGTTGVPIWGFSSTGTAGSATAPGPVLVVHQGDTVTIAVHNQLAQPVSLALPGQPADQITAGLNDTTGAAPQTTKAYTFLASRPGTFLYEAGHTPDGARQVAMGLAGALVVLATDGTASGQSYQDESVVVLSEIDPALNKDPSTFDMRNFHPGWRLINGHPFPYAPEIPTDQGHSVLLRYVNVGSMTHPMSLLGADQLLLAEDGHGLAQPRRETVADVASGATADTLVQMPTGPEAKVTLFEEGSHLDNAGQTEADPTKIATGGMMTFLDTAAPAPVSDFVGPAVSHATVNPPTSDGLSDVTVTADLSDVKSGNANIQAAELVVDDNNPGTQPVAPGYGTKMTGTFGASTAHVTGTIPAQLAPGTSCTDTPVPVVLACLPAGKHTIYVRGQDDSNTGNWGVVSSVVLNLPKTGPATTGGAVAPAIANGSKPLTVSATGDDTDAGGNIDRAEYFVDTVGADGSGTALTTNRTATVVSEDGQLLATPPTGQPCSAYPTAISCLTEGVHHLFVHSHDDLMVNAGRTGLWGPTLDLPFTVDRTGPSVDAAAIGPNPTNGLVSAQGNAGNLVVSASISDTTSGGALQSAVAGAEGFFNPATASGPANGSGFGLVAVDGTFDSPTEAVYGTIPLSQVRTLPDGDKMVYVHGKDAAGNWGDRFPVKLTIDKTAPVLGTATAAPNPTNGAAQLTISAPVTDTALGAAEFWTGSTDPGVGKGTSVPVSVTNGRVSVAVSLVGVPAGTTVFNLRVQDTAGNWSNVVSTQVTVTLPNAIFSDSFATGDLTRWSARTNTGGGSMGTTTGANPALTVTGTGSHFVTDNTPTAEPAYHTSFSLTPGTLSNTTANGGVVLDTRTANGGAGNLVVSVSLRRNAGTNQVRLSMGRSNGTLNGAWVTLPAGTSTVRVDWTSGTTGTARLTVNATPGALLTGNTSALRVESARLGLVTTGTAGTGTFDDFVSTRNTLP